MEAPKKQNIFQKLISGSLPDMEVNTNIGLTQSTLFQTGATLFVAAVLIILAYFTFKKLFQ